MWNCIVKNYWHYNSTLGYACRSDAMGYIFPHSKQRNTKQIVFKTKCFESGIWLVEILLKQMRKFFLNTMEKISIENSSPLPRNRKKKKTKKYFTRCDTNDYVYYNSKSV